MSSTPVDPANSFPLASKINPFLRKYNQNTNTKEVLSAVIWAREEILEAREGQATCFVTIGFRLPCAHVLLPIGRSIINDHVNMDDYSLLLTQIIDLKWSLLLLLHRVPSDVMLLRPLA